MAQLINPRNWKRRLARLERALRPIANREVELSDPDWQTQLARINPLDEAGVRMEAENLLFEILGHYASAIDSPERKKIRDLIADYPSFWWAAVPPSAETARSTLRLRFIHFSLMDQAGDPRDALIWVQELCRAPKVGIRHLKSILREVAEMSSDKDKYGFGSTKAMLLSGCGEMGRSSAAKRRPSHFG